MNRALIFINDPESGDGYNAIVIGWETWRPIEKASPVPPGAVWRTLHPGGPGTKGHPFLLMPVRGSRGQFRVISGGGGKLNGLRLAAVKEPGSYAAEAKQRRHEQAAQERERRAKLTPAERETEKAQKAEAKESRKKAEEKFIRDVFGAAGIPEEQPQMLPEEGSLFPPEDPEDPKEAAQRERQAHQERLAKAKEIVAQAEKKILLDAEARAAAGLQTLGGPASEHGLQIDDLLPDKPQEGPGYQRALGERAEAAGLSAEKLAAAVQEIRERARPPKQEGEPTPMPSPEEERAAQQAKIEAHKATKELNAQKAAATRQAVKQALDRNAKLADLLKARKDFRDAMRQTTDTRPTYERGFQMVVQEDTEAIEQDIYEKMLTGHVRGFLEEVGEAYPEGEAFDATSPRGMEGLEASRGAGAFDCLHEVALAAVGQGMLERDTIEALGPEAAAQVLARGLRRSFDPDDLGQVLAALEHHHLQEQEKLPEITQEAQNLREQARQFQVDLAENARDLGTAIEMQKTRLEALKEARGLLGSALGRLEARAALIAALRQPPPGEMTIPLGRMTPERAVQTAAALGLQDGDYRIDHDSGEALLHLGEQGQERLLAPVDEAAIAERELALAIKGGQLDQEGWLPAGFAFRGASRYDSPIRPTLGSGLAIEHSAPSFLPLINVPPGTWDEAGLSFRCGFSRKSVRGWLHRRPRMATEGRPPNP